MLGGATSNRAAGAWRGLSIAFAAVLLMLAARVYLGRFERLFEDHTIFAGVTYTDAHVTLTGMLVVVGRARRRRGDRARQRRVGAAGALARRSRSRRRSCATSRSASSAGTSTASSSSRTSSCASSPTSRTTSR